MDLLDSIRRGMDGDMKRGSNSPKPNPIKRETDKQESSSSKNQEQGSKKSAKFDESKPETDDERSDDTGGEDNRAGEHTILDVESDISGDVEPGVRGSDALCKELGDSGCGAGEGTDEKEEPGISGEIKRLLEKLITQGEESLAKTTEVDSENVSARPAATDMKGIDVPPAPYSKYLQKAEVLASSIRRKLITKVPRVSEEAAKSGKRVSIPYFIKDRERPFKVMEAYGRDIPDLAFVMVLDRSGSMSSTIEDLKVAAMGIYLACEKLSIPLAILSLEGTSIIKSFSEHGPQVLARLAGLTASTGTVTRPTLEYAEELLMKRSEEIRQIIFIHDGLPADIDWFIPWRKSLVRQNKQLSVFGLYLSEQGEYVEDCRDRLFDLFGRNFAITKVENVAEHLSMFIRNRRLAASKSL